MRFLNNFVYVIYYLLIDGLPSQNLDNNNSSILRTERESKFFPLPAASDDDNMGFLVQCRAMNCNLRIAIISSIFCEVSSNTVISFTNLKNLYIALRASR